MAKQFMILLVLLSGSAVTLSQNDEDCPFGPGSCPVTLDNVVDVYFHDISDAISCQRECRMIEDCKFFTMFGVDDTPIDHMKCFLFKSCDYLEPCPECISGPELPLIDVNNCTNNNDNFTCRTDRDNIVDVYYFDTEDTFSCADQCGLLPDCNFWSFWEETDADGKPHHKCFLYYDCKEQEPCAKCQTGPKP